MAGRSPTLLLALALALAAPAGAQEFKVVAHPGQPTAGLTRTQVSRLFLKQESRWPDGTPAKPVVLTDEAVREAFCRRVHGKSARVVYAYWVQRIFSGQDVPPPERQRASEIVEYVRTTPGAIGYVPADAPAADLPVIELKD